MAKRAAKTKRSRSDNLGAATETVDRRLLVSDFYSGMLDKIERTTRMPSNSMRYLDPLSTGLLTFDRALSGGLRNAFASVAGEEQSGKTTLCYHALAQACRSQTIMNGFIDAEGTLNETFAANVFSPYGLNFMDLMADKKGALRYYRRNVIEQVFDYLHALLRQMPDKMWVAEANSWAYVIPKNNKHFAALKAALQLKEDKALTNESSFMCPTEYSGLEASFFIDSLAAMVTENDDESEERSRVRAAEAAAFSLHLKRVVSRLSSKGVALFGVNQVRKTPGQTYGDPLYEPGGEALKFYSAQRLRMATRVAPKEERRKGEDAYQGFEPSVYADHYDTYHYKAFKSTKNKMGPPKIQASVRVWASDAKGDVRGFDPVYDTEQYLRDTRQLVPSGKRGTMVFKLRDSVGAKRQKFYNDLDPITMADFKLLILAESEGDRELRKSVAETITGFERTKLDLRATLLRQVASDPEVYSKELTAKAVKESSDDDDDLEEI